MLVVKTMEVANKFLKIDVVSKQNLVDSLLEYNSNLLNHQCCHEFKIINPIYTA